MSEDLLKNPDEIIEVDGKNYTAAEYAINFIKEFMATPIGKFAADSMAKTITEFTGENIEVTSVTKDKNSKIIYQLRINDFNVVLKLDLDKISLRIYNDDGTEDVTYSRTDNNIKNQLSSI